MAFNPYFNPYQYGQNIPAPQNQQVQTPFVNVRSEAEARNFPVGFGNVVCFKDESAPYIYTKAMGFSQSDKPIFEKYRKEDSESKPETDYREEIDRLWVEINSLKERRYERNANVSTVSSKPNGNAKPKVQHSTELD